MASPPEKKKNPSTSSNLEQQDTKDLISSVGISSNDNSLLPNLTEDPESTKDPNLSEDLEFTETHLELSLVPDLDKDPESTETHLGPSEVEAKDVTPSSVDVSSDKKSWLPDLNKDLESPACTSSVPASIERLQATKYFPQSSVQVQDEDPNKTTACNCMLLDCKTNGCTCSKVLSLPSFHVGMSSARKPELPSSTSSANMPIERLQATKYFPQSSVQVPDIPNVDVRSLPVSAMLTQVPASSPSLPVSAMPLQDPASAKRQKLSAENFIEGFVGVKQQGMLTKPQFCKLGPYAIALLKQDARTKDVYVLRRVLGAAGFVRVKAATISMGERRISMIRNYVTVLLDRGNQ
ncbi:hypothetical protein TSUD_45960 [Trifolium subterraneum]|nr:hypothetical protein TSUD_45960 [Trifolium subterraneum]